MTNAEPENDKSPERSLYRKSDFERHLEETESSSAIRKKIFKIAAFLGIGATVGSIITERQIENKHQQAEIACQEGEKTHQARVMAARDEKQKETIEDVTRRFSKIMKDLSNYDNAFENAQIKKIKSEQQALEAEKPDLPKASGNKINANIAKFFANENITVASNNAAAVAGLSSGPQLITADGEVISIQHPRILEKRGRSAMASLEGLSNQAPNFDDQRLLAASDGIVDIAGTLIEKGKPQNIDPDEFKQTIVGLLKLSEQLLALQKTKALDVVER